MTLLIIGLLVFFGCHLVPAQPALRGRLVAAMGNNGYRGTFSVVVLVALVLIVWGYGTARDAGPDHLYLPPAFFSHITHLLMLPVFVLLVSSKAHGRITRAVKHPMVLATKLWAFAHLLSNGDVASVVLFGSFLVWAIVDRISLARRQRAGLLTVPDGPLRNDVIAVVVGLAFYAFFFMVGHTWLIGVPVR